MAQLRTTSTHGAIAEMGDRGNDGKLRHWKKELRHTNGFDRLSNIMNVGVCGIDLQPVPSFRADKINKILQ
jgi:hypothetical protein